MVFAHEPYSSNFSTAFDISALSFGYRYPAIIEPTPIAATKRPAPLINAWASLSMFANEIPKRNIPKPTNKVITPPRL